MTKPKIHTVFSPDRPLDKEYAQPFIDAFGQSSVEEADYIFAAGGDGTTLYSLGLYLASTCIPVVSGTPPNSNSVGYRTDHGIYTPEDLEQRLIDPKLITLIPLEAEVTFSNGRKETVHAFNDVSVLRSSRHAACIDLTKIFKDKDDQSFRLKGDGMIISTGMGSTGLNRSHRGQTLDIDDKRIILNGMGIYDPERQSLFNPFGFRPTIESADTIFHAQFAYADKENGRPVRVDYDTGSFERDEDGIPVTSIKVKASSEKSVDIVKKKEEGLPIHPFPI